MRLTILRRLPFLLLVAAFAGWFMLFRPTALGGPASYLWVTGSSMRPTLAGGDFVVARQADSYAAGDIVAFRIPADEPAEGGLVIHRIVGGSAADGYVTQGDNKPLADPWHPRADDILGALWFGVPGAARYIGWLREPAVFAAFAASLTVFSVMFGRANGGRTLGRPGWLARIRSPVRGAAVELPDLLAPYRWAPDSPYALGAVQAQPGRPVPLAYMPSTDAIGGPPWPGVLGPATGIADPADPLAPYGWTIGLDRPDIGWGSITDPYIVPTSVTDSVPPGWPEVVGCDQ
jgi:signal peptidase